MVQGMVLKVVLVLRASDHSYVMSTTGDDIGCTSPKENTKFEIKFGNYREEVGSIMVFVPLWDYGTGRCGGGLDASEGEAAHRGHARPLRDAVRDHLKCRKRIRSRNDTTSYPCLIQFGHPPPKFGILI